MSLPQVNRRKKEPKPKTTTSQKEIEENFSKLPPFINCQEQLTIKPI